MSRRAPKGEYIETVGSPNSNLCCIYLQDTSTNNDIYFQDTGNKVARKAILVGTQNITLGGKTVIQPEVMIRGDLSRTTTSAGGSASGSNTAISIGRYCFFSRGCCLRPPGRFYKGYIRLS